MGMSWTTVFASVTPEQVKRIAEEFQQLIPLLSNPADVSVLHLPHPKGRYPQSQLQLVTFLNRETSFDSPPDICTFAFASFGDHTQGPEREFYDWIVTEPNATLALLASTIVGEATFIIFSDSLCCSGYLTCQNGTVHAGEIYGWEGTEYITNIFEDGTIGTGTFGSSAEERDYSESGTYGLETIFGEGVEAWELAEEYDSDPANTIRYRLMYKKELVLKIEPEPYQKSPEPSPSPESLKPDRALPQEAMPARKKPWWRFW